MFKSSNPALASETFTKEASKEVGTDQAMTVNGAVWKTFFLLILMLFPATYTWGLFAAGTSVTAYMWGGAIGGLVVALVTVFKKPWSPYTAPLYAVLEGLFLGGISAFFEQQFQGIVFQAVGLTFGTLFTLLAAYQTGLIQVTQKFRTGVMAATGGVAVFYLLSFVLGMFGVQIPLIHSSGLFGIGFSVVVVIIAALNLVLDFDFIYRGAQANAPKYMEWFAAFGLMVTLIWLYIEILRLLSKIRR